MWVGRGTAAAYCHLSNIDVNDRQEQNDGAVPLSGTWWQDINTEKLLNWKKKKKKNGGHLTTSTNPFFFPTLQNFPSWWQFQLRLNLNTSVTKASTQTLLIVNGYIFQKKYFGGIFGSFEFKYWRSAVFAVCEISDSCFPDDLFVFCLN